jgi:MerR family transcriptional regulator, light-induced transcriptional regulator
VTAVTTAGPIPWPCVNLQEAASQLDVHYQTVYRWVRDGTLLATKTANTYDVTEFEVERLLAERAEPAPPPKRIRVRSWTQHVDRLLDALLTGDELAARTTVERLAQGQIGAIELCQHVIAPCMTEVGLRWHSGTVSIAEEHRATAICDRIIARLSNHHRGRPRGTAVVTTAAGDLHTLPSAMAALVLREDRWKVHHLGGNLPHDDVVALVQDVEADLVVISVTNTEVDRSVRALEEAVRATGAYVLVGRPGLTLQQLVDHARALPRTSMT